MQVSGVNKSVESNCGKWMLDFILGIFATVTTYVGGQFILKLVIEPAQEMKRTIGCISHSLIKFNKDISNRPIDNNKAHEIYDHLNELAAKLQASFYLIPKWIRKNDCLTSFFGFPSQENIIKSSQQLESLASSLYSLPNESRIYEEITYRKKEICKYLDIFMPEVK